MGLHPDFTPTFSPVVTPGSAFRGRGAHRRLRRDAAARRGQVQRDGDALVLRGRDFRHSATGGFFAAHGPPVEA